VPDCTPRAQDMMVGEAQIARRQRHANVMPLLASFLHGQELWMVLPLCRCTLRGLLDAAYPRARPRPAPTAFYTAAADNTRPALHCTSSAPPLQVAPSACRSRCLRVCECLSMAQRRMQTATERRGQPLLADARPWVQGLDERALATVLREVLAGVAYLHGRGIVHRDIKVPRPLLPGAGAGQPCASRMQPACSSAR